MQAEGRVFKYGDNVDTDVIIPARYLNATTGEELAKHCMEDIDKEFIHKVQPGDIIVAEKNFGCGSSREHAPLAIKCAGVSCVIAETFARIFYRNAINIGLPIIECPEAAAAIRDGDQVEVDFDRGIIHNRTKDESYEGQAFPPFMQKIIAAGGLVNYINAGAESEYKKTEKGRTARRRRDPAAGRPVRYACTGRELTELKNTDAWPFSSIWAIRAWETERSTERWTARDK